MSEKFRREVNKKVGQNVIAKGNEILETERWSTGSLGFDVELGGGIPEGRIISIVGPWSSGKTSVTIKIAAGYQKKHPDKDIYWIDAEGVWDPKWCKVLGLNPEKVYVVRPQYGEQAYNIALGAIDSGAGLVVIDSVAALASKAEMEGDMDSIQVAAMARVNSKFMRKMASGFPGYDVPPTLIYLNQQRQNVGGYGSPIIEPGGEALSFYPSIKIVLNKGELTDGEKVYKNVGINDEGVESKGQKIKFYTEKNKTAPWKRRGHFWFFFDNVPSIGVKKGTYDRLDEIIRYTAKYEIVNQRGKMYDLINPTTGEVQTFEGQKRLASYIREDEPTRKWVEKAVMDAVLNDMAGNDDRPEKEREEPIVQEEPVVRLRPVELDDEEEGNQSSEAA